MTHVLMIKCPDAKGLVFAISGILYRHGFNIVSNHEFVDSTTDTFFMRTAFSGDADGSLAGELGGVLPKGAEVRVTRVEKQPIVILATKEPHCLGDLLLRHACDEMPAQVRAVVSNHAELGELVRRFGIPFHFIAHKDGDRAAHEQAVLAAVAPYAPRFIVLAKYMRTLSPAFLAAYPERIINIHHSFLPAFAGAKPYRQAFERGVKIIGATAHIVTADLDSGPILAQGILPVDHTHTAADMAQAGREIEKFVLAKALHLMLEDRVFLHHNRTVIFD